MISADKYNSSNPDHEVVSDYPGTKGPLYMETTHRGCVLHLGEHNYYDDSDFYAVVWDAAKGAPVTVTYGTTRAWTYPNTAQVDATPEVREAYEEYRAQQEAEYNAAKAQAEAAVPYRGKAVKVVHGRKVPVGTTGRVFWFGRDKYARFYGTDTDRYGLPDARYHRVGIETANGERYFTSMKNVEVVAG